MYISILSRIASTDSVGIPIYGYLDSAYFSKKT